MDRGCKLRIMIVSWGSSRRLKQSLKTHLSSGRRTAVSDLGSSFFSALSVSRDLRKPDLSRPRRLLRRLWEPEGRLEHHRGTQVFPPWNQRGRSLQLLRPSRRFIRPTVACWCGFFLLLLRWQDVPFDWAKHVDLCRLGKKKFKKKFVSADFWLLLLKRFVLLIKMVYLPKTSLS